MSKNPEIPVLHEQIDADLKNQSISLTANEEVDHSKSIEAGLYASHLLSDSGDQLTFEHETNLRLLVEMGRRSMGVMVDRNQGLVVSLAKMTHTDHLTLQDKIQEGNIGLVEAIRKFDYKRGYKFSTLATKIIKTSIRRARDYDDREIRLPQHLSRDVDDIKRAYNEYLESFGGKPSEEELAILSGQSVDRVQIFYLYNRGYSSLDAQVDDDRSVADILEYTNEDTTDGIALRNITSKRLWEELGSLSQSDRQLLILRYGLCSNGEIASFDKLAKRLGSNRESIRRKEHDLLAELRRRLEDIYEPIS